MTTQPAYKIVLIFLSCLGTYAVAQTATPPESTPTMLLRLKHEDCFFISFSPDGNLIATGGGTDFPGPGQVKVWNAHTGKLLHEETFECDIQGVAFSPDGKNLAIADDEADESGLIRDVKTWKRKHTLQNVGLTSELAYSPNSKYVASGGGMDEDGDEYPAHLWNAATGKKLRTLSRSKGTIGIVFTPDSQKLAGFGDDFVSIWEVSTGRLLTRQPHPNVRCFALSPDGATLATCSCTQDYNFNAPGDIRLWDVRTGQWKRTFTHDTGIVSIAYSPDGALRASADLKGLVRVMDAETGKAIREWQAISPKSAQDGLGSLDRLEFSRDGKLLAVSDRNQVLVWAIR